MPMSKGRDAGEFVRIHRASMSLEVLDDSLHVGGVPEGDHVEHEAESAEFFFLPFPVACDELAASTVTHAPGEAVAVFLPIELDEDASALLGIVDIVEHMDRFDDASKFGESAGEWCGAFLHLENRGRANIRVTSRQILRARAPFDTDWPAGAGPRPAVLTG